MTIEVEADDLAIVLLGVAVATAVMFGGAGFAVGSAKAARTQQETPVTYCNDTMARETLELAANSLQAAERDVRAALEFVATGCPAVEGARP